MSWQVDGVYYHNYAEYQRALSNRDAAQARSEANSLRADAERHRQRAAAAEQAVRDARGQIERQERARAELAGHVRELERTQQQLARAQADAEARTERKFREVEASVRDQAEHLEAVRRAHREHAAEVKRTFEDVRREVAAGFAEAERRRAETERVLRDEIQAVDAKVEDDRRAKLAKETTDASRAAVLLATADGRAAGLAARRDQLDLHDGLTELELASRKARAYLAAGDATQALVEANAADRAADRCEREAVRRAAELDAQKAFVEVAVADLTAALNRTDATGTNLVRTFFAREAARAEAALADIRARAGTTYTNHRQLEARRVHDERALAELEGAVRTMTASAPLAREMFEERLGKVNEIMADLRHRFGPESRLETGLVDPADPKSAQVVWCDYGGKKLDVYVPLEPDAPVRLDGYKHDTDTECAAAAQQALQLPHVRAGLAAVQSSNGRRTEPLAPPAAAANPWAGLADQLNQARNKM